MQLHVNIWERGQQFRGLKGFRKADLRGYSALQGYFAGLLRLFVLVMISFWTIAAYSADSAEILKVRFGPDGNKTRIVIDIAGEPVFELSGADIGEGRLIIDFDDVRVDETSLKSRAGVGHVGTYRFAKGENLHSQLVFDLKRTARIDNMFVLEPAGRTKHYRLVIDLHTANKAGFLASVPKILSDDRSTLISASTAVSTPASPKTAISRSAYKGVRAPSLKPVARLDLAQTDKRRNEVSTGSNDLNHITAQKQQKRNVLKDKIVKPSSAIIRDAQSGKITVVIDPGHGGGHPGAVGQNGTLEKDVNLAAAKILAEKLVKTGRYRVVMTRVDDRLVMLHRRAEIAREVDAQLFISLHADGNNDRTLRGSSVYTISEAGTKRSIKEAREQESYRINDRELSEFSPLLGNILFDVSQDATISQSATFADKLLKRLGKVTPLVKNAQRKEDLKVLLRPDVPAVLLEMAFISNVEDERKLKNKTWRNRTMGAVALAIDDYFNTITLSQIQPSIAGSNVGAGTTSSAN